MVKFKVTYKNPSIPISLKKLVVLKAKTPEEAWEEIKSEINLEKHAYLFKDIKNLVGVEQQELE
ncbi:MAG: hypothetical protein WCW13_06870 [archaeon]|jgi:hypothetical protein